MAVILISGLRWKLSSFVKSLCVSRLWYTIPGEDDQEGRMFHLIKDDKDAMFMTGLVGSHGHIHVYV